MTCQCPTPTGCYLPSTSSPLPSCFEDDYRMVCAWRLSACSLHSCGGFGLPPLRSTMLENACIALGLTLECPTTFMEHYGVQSPSSRNSVLLGMSKYSTSIPSLSLTLTRVSLPIDQPNVSLTGRMLVIFEYMTTSLALRWKVILATTYLIIS